MYKLVGSVKSIQDIREIIFYGKSCTYFEEIVENVDAFLLDK